MLFQAELAGHGHGMAGQPEFREVTLQARLGVPVFDIVTLTTMAHAALTRRPYGWASTSRRRAANSFGLPA